MLSTLTCLLSNDGSSLGKKCQLRFQFWFVQLKCVWIVLNLVIPYSSCRISLYPSLWMGKCKVFSDFKSSLLCFFDLELISCHYLSCGSCSCWGNLFEKAEGSSISNQIGMKFGRIVLQINTHWLLESYFWYDVIMSYIWRPWCDFTQKSAAIWWVHTECLPGTYAAGSTSSWFIVHLRLVIKYVNIPSNWPQNTCRHRNFATKPLMMLNVVFCHFSSPCSTL